MSSTYTDPNRGSSATTTSTSTSSARPKTDERREVKEGYETLRDDVNELAQSVRRLVQSEFGDAAANAQDRAQQTLGSVEQHIRQKPTQSALIAAGVGFLVGLIIAR